MLHDTTAAMGLGGGAGECEARSGGGQGDLGMQARLPAGEQREAEFPSRLKRPGSPLVNQPHSIFNQFTKKLINE